jgi:hypothetical protein
MEAEVVKTLKRIGKGNLTLSLEDFYKAILSSKLVSQQASHPFISTGDAYVISKTTTTLRGLKRL